MPRGPPSSAPLWPRPARPQGALSPSLAASVSRALDAGLGLSSRCSARGWRRLCSCLLRGRCSGSPGWGRRAGRRWAEGGEKTRTTLQTRQAPSGWTVPVARTSWSRGQADLTGRVRAPAVVRGPRRCLRSQVVGAHPAPPPAWSEGGPEGGSDSSESRGFGGAEWGPGDRTRRSRLPAPCSGLCRARRACVPAWVGAAAQTPVLSRDRLRAEPRGSPWPARPRPPAQVPTAPHVGGRIVLCGGLSDALEDVWPLPTRCH